MPPLSWIELATIRLPVPVSTTTPSNRVVGDGVPGPDLVAARVDLDARCRFRLCSPFRRGPCRPRSRRRSCPRRLRESRRPSLAAADDHVSVLGESRREQAAGTDVGADHRLSGVENLDSELRRLAVAPLDVERRSCCPRRRCPVPASVERDAPAVEPVDDVALAVRAVAADRVVAAPSAMSTPSLVSNVLVPSASSPMYEPSTTLSLDRDAGDHDLGRLIAPPFAAEDDALRRRRAADPVGRAVRDPDAGVAVAGIATRSGRCRSSSSRRRCRDRPRRARCRRRRSCRSRGPDRAAAPVRAHVAAVDRRIRRRTRSCRRRRSAARRRSPAGSCRR